MTKTICKEIFRAYDIRGIVDEQLDEYTIEQIGLALGSQAQNQNCKTIVLGRDGRLSSPRLWAALTRGLLSSGMNIIDVGAVPTPVLYFATYYYQTGCGAMLTGSHNPAQYNGVKMIIGGKSLADGDVENLYNRIINKDFIYGTGSYQENFIIPAYIEDVLSKITLNKKLRIVIDCGNGIAGVIAPELFRALGCEVISLYEEVDGNFPNHHPDPSKIENLRELKKAVLENKADLGLAFDGDADRLGVITNTGELVMPDRQMMLFSRSILKHNPKSTIVFDIKCSSHLERYILKHNGVPLMWKTGHSYIKNKMLETQALLAGEMSGHIFFKERWFGFDDGLYAGVRMLDILSNDYPDNSLQGLINELPNSINTPELNIAIEEHEKFGFINKLINNHNFKDYKNIINIDGLRVEFSDGWGLIRASNTTPCLVLRFEAISQESLQKIMDEFQRNIKLIDDRLMMVRVQDY
ncbi:MAG: phosphomannomutase/phosphoglucomutase [Gammaproteobacteria bacterium]|nr:phosphomannomutase/phosphoglucomutase [Gammaproteobacteria bacterium]